MMASIIYNSALADALSGSVDFEANDFRAMLCTAAYVPDKDAHSRRSDVTDEVTGTGYAAGGEVVTVAMEIDPVSDRIDAVFAEVDWPASTITARYAVYYKDSGTGAASDPLIMAVDFGTDYASTNGLFSVGASTLRIQN